MPDVANMKLVAVGNPIELHRLDISPSQDQMVVAGDNFSMECWATNVLGEGGTHMVWSLGESGLPANISVDFRLSDDRGLIVGRLNISQLSPQHNGNWTCFAYTSRNNQTTSRRLSVGQYSTKGGFTSRNELDKIVCSSGSRFRPILGKRAPLEKTVLASLSAEPQISPRFKKWEPVDSSSCLTASFLTLRMAGRCSMNFVVQVLDPAGVKCPSNHTLTTRGSFYWPESPALGQVISIPCESEQDGSPLASHICGPDGQWQKLEVSRCQLTSEFARVMGEYVARIGSQVSAESASFVPPILKTYLLNETTDRVILDADYVDLVLQALENILSHAVRDIIFIANACIQSVSAFIVSKSILRFSSFICLHTTKLNEPYVCCSKNVL